MQLAARHPTSQVSELISIAQDVSQQLQPALQPQQLSPHYSATVSPHTQCSHMWSQLSAAQQQKLHSLPDVQRQQVRLKLLCMGMLASIARTLRAPGGDVRWRLLAAARLLCPCKCDLSYVTDAHFIRRKPVCVDAFQAQCQTLCAPCAP
jgi:hypothetical protein